MIREYLASVRGVDRNVGRMLAELDRLALRENTVVIFSSDHGYNMGHNGIWHKGNGHWVLKREALPPATKNIPRGQRPNLFDNALRVPTSVRWPGKIKAGSVLPHTISTVDWFPTLVQIAKGQLPKDQPVRGRNFLPLLFGKSVEWDNDFYAEYSTKHQSRTHMRGWRTPKWKLVRDFLNEGRDELYDLSKDPEETNNLINSEKSVHQNIIRELHSKILAKMEELMDPALELARKR